MKITISIEDAITWLAYACRTDRAQIHKLGLTDDQTVIIGQWLSLNQLLNPPTHRPTKTMTARCKTCGQYFIDTFTTKRWQHCINCRRK